MSGLTYLTLLILSTLVKAYFNIGYGQTKCTLNIVTQIKNDKPHGKNDKVFYSTIQINYYSKKIINYKKNNPSSAIKIIARSLDCELALNLIQMGYPSIDILNTIAPVGLIIFKKIIFGRMKTAWVIQKQTYWINIIIASSNFVSADN